jgi:hypothetical protein
MLKPRPCRVGEVNSRLRMMTSSVVAPPSWHARR